MGCGRGVVKGVLVHGHDTEAPGVPMPVATRVWGLGGFHHGVSHRNQYRRHCCQDLAGADVFNLRYCQSEGLKPAWEGEQAWAELHGHVW